MLTTDPVYMKALLPVITIKNTANNSTLYTYSSFTGAATGSGLTNVFPLFCSVNLSQNTFGEFTIQFDDPNQIMDSTVTVGSRVFIDCGKQSGSTTRLISGLIRKKGHSRGSDNRILYNISGSSTGIRLNEIIAYNLSEAAKLADGITLDLTDASRKADTLLASFLSGLTSDGILSIANLAANSDVETFIANLSIEYAELQDGVNYIEEQSGGEVIVDTNDLVNFRYEIKNNLFGRGFTIKNSFIRTNNSDDADDTMYLRGKNWSYEDDFYKSSSYANRIYGILQAQNRPSDRSELGYTVSPAVLDGSDGDTQIAVKFRPTHVRHFASDFMFVGGYWNTVPNIPVPRSYAIFIYNDNAGIPSTNSAIGGIVFNAEQFQDPISTTSDDSNYQIHIGDFIYNYLTSTAEPIYLDTTQNYWMVFDKTTGQVPITTTLLLGKNSIATGANYRWNNGPNYATPSTGGTSWSSLNAGTVAIGVGRYRSHSLVMSDPKAMQAISNGFPAGQSIQTVLQDTSSQVTTFESMYRHLANELYVMANPRTTYNFPAVMAPNTPPVPGDPIVISDTVLGLSSTGNQVVLTTCGDMTYQWGNMGSGDYQAPTILNINAIGVHPRYN